MPSSLNFFGSKRPLDASQSISATTTTTITTASAATSSVTAHTSTVSPSVQSFVVIPKVNAVLDEVLLSSRFAWDLSSSCASLPSTLLEALSQKFPHIMNWNERFEWGGILVNGRPMPLHTSLLSLLLARIEFFQPKVEWEKRYEQYPSFVFSEHVVYHEQGLLIVFKPAGLPTNPSKDQHRCCLQTQLLEQFGGVHMPSRLDMGTSGLIAVSTEKALNKHLQLVFEKHHIHKEYLFVAQGKWPWAAGVVITVDRRIGRHPDHPILRTAVVGEEDSKGYILDNGKVEVPKEAITRMVLIRQKDNYCLILAAPLTGRTHQIRVHTASLGFSIVGDSFYGGAHADVPGQELNLMSYRIQLPYHPLSKQPVNVCVPPRLLPSWVTSVFHPSENPHKLIDTASLASTISVEEVEPKPEKKSQKKKRHKS